MPGQRTERDNELLRHFGERLRQARLAQGLTQEQLAAEAGFSRSYYTEIETGKRNIALLNLYKLAHRLGISPKELLNDE